MSPDEPFINLTPLIDVVFVVLIFFILVAPLLQVDKVDLALGSSKRSNPAGQGDASIVIHVRKNNSVFLNHHEVDLQRLPFLLAKENKLHPHTTPQLFQDKEATFGTYQAVKNAAELAGFAELDLILEPSSEKSS